MDTIPLWNQLHLPCPATAAHKIVFGESTHLQVTLNNFLKAFADKLKKLQEIILSMKSETMLLKRFLYKLAAVFSHDKSYKVLKQIYKTITRVIESSITSDLNGFREQHTSGSTSSKVMFVAPKPKYEYILVRLQGIFRVLAQVLSLCQHCGSMIVKKLQLGHFVNIFIIQMSFISRIWALSLHTCMQLSNLYDEISQIFQTKGLVPASTVSFLPEIYALPSSLIDWILSDESLQGISRLLQKGPGKNPNSTRTNIWQAIKVDDDEQTNLTELKDLITSNADENMERIRNLSVEEINALENKLNGSADLGELVSRETNIPRINNKKRKRAKELKEN